jgi:hypothetical protein
LHPIPNQGAPIRGDLFSVAFIVDSLQRLSLEDFKDKAF